MTTHIGNSGKVAIGAVFLAEVVDFVLNQKAQAVEDSELTDAFDSFVAGSKNWSGSLNCHWSPEDTTGQEALAVGATVSLLLYPIGSAQGSTYFSGSAVITEVGVDTKRNNMIARSISFQGSGTLTQTTVA